VGYHNAERMGYPAQDADPMVLYTSKKIAAIGDTIWIVAGESQRPKQYFLRSQFILSKITPADHPDFGFALSGTEGGPIDRPALLNGKPWFDDFFKAMAHFSLGLSEITQSEVIKEFNLLAHQSNEGDTMHDTVREIWQLKVVAKPGHKARTPQSEDDKQRADLLWDQHRNLIIGKGITSAADLLDRWNNSPDEPLTINRL
jgi:hypothetical protein